jgi:hypothetical protein
MKVIKMEKTKSLSDDGVEYLLREVEHNGEKYWLCNCPDFIFRGKLGYKCKHILNYLEEEKDDRKNTRQVGKLEKLGTASKRTLGEKESS